MERTFASTRSEVSGHGAAPDRAPRTLRSPLRTLGLRASLLLLGAAVVVWRGFVLLGDVPGVPGRPARYLGLAFFLAAASLGLAAVCAHILGSSAPALAVRILRRVREVMAASLRLGRRHAGILAGSVIIGFVALHTVKGPVQPCGTVPSDCFSYLWLVEELSFPPPHQAELQAAWEAQDRLDGSDRWEGFGSQHFMRVLPPLLVRGLTWGGLTPDQGFRLLSSAATLAFGLAVFLLLLSLSGRHVLSLGVSLLILGLHPQMTTALRDVYRSTEPLAFFLGILLVAATVAGRHRWVGVLGLLGILTKQPLLVLGGFALTFLLLRSPDRAVQAEIVGWGTLLGVSYLALGFQFQAHESVARHMLPTAGPSTLAHNFVAHGGLSPLIGLVPLLLLAGRRILDVSVRYWFIPITCAILIVQPAMRLGEISGQGNLERNMLHGVWPLYFLAALAVEERRPSLAASLVILVIGAFFFDGRTPYETRKWLVGVAALAIVGSWIMRRTKQRGIDPCPSPT